MDLRAIFGDRLIDPSSASYESARRVWNGGIDRRPRFIARCREEGEIAAAIRWARENQVEIAVRGGGHNVAGHSVCDGGLVLDLGPMKRIEIDGDIARAGPGLTWGEFDAATQGRGLATTGGLISSTGIAGLTLGGGIGWLMRKHGLACDNLAGVELVDASGERHRADDRQNSELFWALRGGGGNFGVVTRFEYRLHPVGQVYGGQMLFPASMAGEVLRAFRALIAAAPDDLTTMLAFLTAPPLPFVPAGLRGRAAVAIAGCACGDLSGEVLAPLRALNPALDAFAPMPYLALQTMLDGSAPAGMAHYWKSDYLEALPDAAIDVLVAQAQTMPGPFSQLHVHQLGGAVARRDEDATAYPRRSAALAVNAIGTWTEGTGAAHVAWSRGAMAALRPHSLGAGYLNFGSDIEPAASFGPRKLERLKAVKRRYDPANVFHYNQNISP